LPRVRGSQAAGLFVAGALGGAALDQIHVQAGVLAYPHANLLDQPWWVGPQFGVAVVAMVLTARPLARGMAPAGTARLGAGALWFTGAYAASGLLGNRHPGFLASALGATWVVRVARRRERGPVVVASVVLALAGVVYEGTLCGAGVFHYVHPSVYHVPIWLAGLYLQGAPLLLDVTRLLDDSSRPARAVASAR
jgi:hypothetical protein